MAAWDTPYIDRGSTWRRLVALLAHRRVKQRIRMTVAACAMGGFSALLWHGYSESVRTNGDVPLLRADAGLTKVRPENPGGLKVPHQGLTIWQSVNPTEAKDRTEQARLLPGAEEPIERKPPVLSAADPNAPALERMTLPAEPPKPVTLPPRPETEVAATDPAPTRPPETKPALADPSVASANPDPARPLQPAPAVESAKASEPAPEAADTEIAKLIEELVPRVAPERATTDPRDAEVTAHPRPVPPARARPDGPPIALARLPRPSDAEDDTDIPAAARPTSNARARAPDSSDVPVAAAVPRPPPVPGSRPDIPDTDPARRPAPRRSTAETTRIQLASLPSQNDARRESQRLKRRYSELLQGVDLTVVPADIPGRGRFYRIQTAPMAGDRATDVCATVRRLNGGCLIVR